LRRSILLGLTILIVIPLGSAWATTDLTTLGSPDVTISPLTGPPGASITVTVSNLPDISKESYPYPDLYIYLPFSQPFGVTVPSHCGGEDCFPIYTHGDSLNKNFGDRTITFSLFSTNNPKPIFDNGYENSVCDVVVNNVIVERYSTLCNTKDQPTGTYQIKLVWALETNLEQSYTVKTVQFTVTPGSPSPPSPVAENGNTVVKEYQSGTITGAEFVSKLRALGWNDEQIRQALASIGKLPHQMGGTGPDNTQTILQQVIGSTQNMEKPNSATTANNVQQSPESTIVSTPKSTNEPTAVQTQPSSLSPLNSTPLPPQQNNSSWNSLGIAVAIGASATVAGVVFVVKITRKSVQ
jgi:hypothetical protein